MGAAFPVEPQYTFKMAETPFPKENRNATGEVQVNNENVTLYNSIHTFCQFQYDQCINDEMYTEDISFAFTHIHIFAS